MCSQNIQAEQTVNIGPDSEVVQPLTQPLVKCSKRFRMKYALKSLVLVVFWFALIKVFVADFSHIPSESMLPTLQQGDRILATRSEYGLRLPYLDESLIQWGTVNRGDAIVFKHPIDKVDYLKRAIGIPGDTVEYDAVQKRLTLNGNVIAVSPVGSYIDPVFGFEHDEMEQSLDGKAFDIIHNPRKSGDTYLGYAPENQTACVTSENYVKCVVPQGHYFFMGDNRDDSLDSRHFGVVPHSMLVGRAFVMVVNLKELSRKSALL